MNQQPSLHQKLTLVIGLLAGSVFSFMAWGRDAYVLSQNYLYTPWIKFVMGFPVVTIILTLSAWFGEKVNNLVFRVLLWIGTAIIVSRFASFLSFKWLEGVMKSLIPELSGQFNYVLPASIKGRLFIISIMSVILFIIGGLLLDMAIETLIRKSGVIGWIFPLLLCLTFFAGAGYVVDSNFNIQLRIQVSGVNEQIDMADEFKEASSITDRQARLIQRFTRLGVPLSPRKLVIASFDESFSQSQIFINFDSEWARCSALNGTIGYCELFTTPNS